MKLHCSDVTMANIVGNSFNSAFHVCVVHVCVWLCVLCKASFLKPP